MSNLIIKICGIRDVKLVPDMANAGANYMGLVFHPDSPRHINTDDAIILAQSARHAGLTPVAVFVHQTAQEMQQICKLTHIDVVQLHGPTARSQHHLLADHYQRIYAQPAIESDILQCDDAMAYLDADRDWILVDHPDPGSGKKFNWQKFTYTLKFRWFLAGGLSAANVALATYQLQPHGVDVSSGVENASGHKDIQLIKQFIQTARGTACR